MSEESIVVINYGMGNPASVANMLKAIGAKSLVSGDPGVIARAHKLILPGVGAWDAGMKELQDRGLQRLLTEQVVGLEKPILGICLGMQLLAEASEEGSSPGLGWIPGRVVRFSFENGDRQHRIPHMGWSNVRTRRTSPLFNELNDTSRFYFVHSYHFVCTDNANALADTDYGIAFTSAIQRNNILGVQFHPEKSHRYGMQLLRNFVELQ